MTKLIELRNICRAYGVGDAKTVAVSDVNLIVESGEFVAITGPSGSGKSTLLNIIGLLESFDAGELFVSGVAVASRTEKQRDHIRGSEFGFVFQDSHGVETRSVLDNVTLPLTLRGIRPGVRNARAREALATVGLARRENHLVKQLSGGERQRMAIARALAGRPSVLLVDEPTGSLDSTNANGILDLLTGLNEGGVTVVAVTHDERLATRASRRVDIKDGKIVADVSAPGREAKSSSMPHLPRASWGGRVKDRVLDSIQSVAERRTKSALNIGIIALGVAGLVAGVGVNESASSQVTDIFNEAALDEVRIASGATAPRLTDESAQRVSELQGVQASGLFYLIGDGRISATRLPVSVPQTTEFKGSMFGVTPGALDVLGVSQLEAWSSFGDPAITSRSVLLGTQAADALSIKAPAPDIQIWVNGTQFSVMGIVTGDERHASVNNAILFSASAVEQYLSPQLAPTLIARTDPGLSRAVAMAAPLAIDAAHPERYTPQSTADLAELQSAVDRSLGGWFLAIAAILLVVAALSTSGSLSASVLNRQKEIGLRRALGSPRGAVASLFMREGFILGLLGGLTGSAIGSLCLTFLAAQQGWSLMASPSTLGAGILLGALTGSVASLAAAVRGARLQPATALRE